MVWPKNGGAKQTCLGLLLTLNEVQEANDQGKAGLAVFGDGG